MSEAEDTPSKAELSDRLHAGQHIDIARDAVEAKMAASFCRDLAELPRDELFQQATGQGRAAILDQARQAVTKDRAATHGAVEASFMQIAALWSVRLGVTITPAQVSIMMIDLKTVRAWHNPGHADNWIDICGYGACGGEVAGVKV